MVFAIIGNKIDLHEYFYFHAVGRSQLRRGDASQLSRGVMFFECSAKSGRGVDEVFLDLSQAILEKVEKGEIDPNDENGGVKIGDI
jgi:GTPase SAR1 family protein